MADIKLLLVEDDENLAYMEKSCFEDIIEGYEVKTAVNGRQGLEEWKTFQPDVIVSDIDMPIMDGLEMVRKYVRWMAIPSSSLPLALHRPKT